LPRVQSPGETEEYPGARLGLPASGAGAVAGWGRRILALVIDWGLSLLAASAFVGGSVWSASASRQWLPLVVFAVEVWVLTTLAGGSAGQLICRVTVRRTSGRPLGLLRALIRTLLICAVVPPVIYNRDRQGLHDMAVDSITLQR
jgi:RDD family